MKQYIISYTTKQMNYWSTYTRTSANTPKEALAKGFDLTISEFLRLRGDDATGLVIKAKAYKPTISDIADNCGPSHYFDKQTLKFFGQTRGMFKVTLTDDPTVFHISARNKHGVSQSNWTFDPALKYWREV